MIISVKRKGWMGKFAFRQFWKDLSYWSFIIIYILLFVKGWSWLDIIWWVLEICLVVLVIIFYFYNHYFLRGESTGASLIIYIFFFTINKIFEEMLKKIKLMNKCRNKKIKARLNKILKLIQRFKIKNFQLLNKMLRLV